MLYSKPFHIIPKTHKTQGYNRVVTWASNQSSRYSKKTKFVTHNASLSLYIYLSIIFVIRKGRRCRVLYNSDIFTRYKVASF